MAWQVLAINVKNRTNRKRHSHKTEGDEAKKAPESREQESNHVFPLMRAPCLYAQGTTRSKSTDSEFGLVFASSAPVLASVIIDGPRDGWLHLRGSRLEYHLGSLRPFYDAIKDRQHF